jgi:predicted kinase
MKSLRNLILEVIVEEEQLDEKLITYNNRKPYGQVVFLVGGAGSGKGFAGSKFLDSAGFKVRDVDEMKKQLQILNRLGKITAKDILKKYGSNIKSNDLNLINKVFNTETPQGGQQTIRNLNLKNPDHVYVLHILVKAMGIKEKSLENLLAGKSNPEVLPNIMFDITAKDLSDITEVLPQLKDAGYKSENIHLTWILTNYVTAMQQNKSRERMVPEDILLKTHEGAANTIWGLITRALPSGMAGRVDVVLNNPENTIYYTDADGNEIKGAVKGFLSLPVKKAGGGIFPEKLWKDTLFQWIKDNAPDVITKNMK